MTLPAVFDFSDKTHMSPRREGEACRKPGGGAGAIPRTRISPADRWRVFVHIGSSPLRRRSAGSLTENVANRDKICDYHKKTKNM